MRQGAAPVDATPRGGAFFAVLRGLLDQPFAVFEVVLHCRNISRRLTFGQHHFPLLTCTRPKCHSSPNRRTRYSKSTGRRTHAVRPPPPRSMSDSVLRASQA